MPIVLTVILKNINKFYDQPLFLQWLEAILLFIAGFYPAIMIIELTYTQSFYALLFFIYLPLGQFAITPIFRLSGIYKYYSAMLIGYMANKLQIDLHSGGSFDYLFVMRKYKMGISFRKRLLTYHIEGLLNIISEIENGKIPHSVIIVGTSYFFNERTINKLGFEQQKPSLFYRFNLFVNFIDLTWMYSIAQGRFAIPKLWKANKAQIEGGKLLEKKEMIKLLYNRMQA